MRKSLFLTASVLLALSACQSDEQAQAYITNEDSHPHEVYPGAKARFYVDASGEPARIAVHCTVFGPAAPIKLSFHGITPEGWIVENPTFEVERDPIDIEIKGIVDPNAKPAPYFAFANRDPKRLFWHQCYNRRME